MYCCSLSHVQLFKTPWTAAHKASLSFTISRNLLKLMSIESVMLSNYPSMLSTSLPSVFPSIRVFFNESALCSAVQFSCSVLSNSLQPHGLQHTRLPCPSPTPRAYSVSVVSVMPFNHLILCHLLLLLPPMFPSIRKDNIPMSQFFASGGQSIGVSASASVLPNEYSGLISFRIDWFDLLPVQGTLKGLFQHHNLKASVLWHSAFFKVQLSHLYTLLEKP